MGKKITLKRRACILLVALIFALTGMVSHASDSLDFLSEYMNESDDSGAGSGEATSDADPADTGSSDSAESGTGSSSEDVTGSDTSSSGSEEGSTSGTGSTGSVSTSSGSASTPSSGTGSTGSTGSSSESGGTSSSRSGTSSSSSSRSTTSKSTEAAETDSASSEDTGTNQAGNTSQNEAAQSTGDTGTSEESQEDNADGYQLIYDINIAYPDEDSGEETEEGETEESVAADHTSYIVDQTYESGSTELALSIEEAFPYLEETTDNGMGYTDQYRKFVRWSTEPDGSGVTLDPEEEMVFSDHDIILYAIWTKMDLTMSVDKDGDGDYDDDGSQTAIGDEVTYRIFYTNGYGYSTSLTITEELDEGLTFVSAESGTYDEETCTLTWYLNDVESGMNGTLEFTASVNENAVKKPEIESVASVRVGDDPAVTTNRARNWVPIEITVSSTWDDNEDEEEIRPESLQISLLADGEQMKDPAELNGENSWAYTWKDLPAYSNGKEITYTVEQEPVEGYDQEYGEMKDLGEGKFSIALTNEFVSTTVKIGGSVTWLDVSEEEDYSRKRPEEMTVHLYANGEKVRDLTLTEEDGWDWEISGLNKYDEDGIPITYTVTTDIVKDYITEIDGYEIANSYCPYKMNLNVQLIWDDKDDENDTRPDSMVVELLENGEKTGDTLTLDASNGFSGCFTSLDEYDNGENIEYTVQAFPINGYKTFLTEERDMNCIILRSVPLTTDAEAETEADLTDNTVDTGDDIHWWSFLLG